MNNVLPFAGKRPPFACRLTQKDQGSRETVIFLSGVTATMIAPVVGYCANSGPVPPTVFAGIALLGTILGLMKYGGFFDDGLTILGVGASPRIDENVEVNLKKVA